MWPKGESVVLPTTHRVETLVIKAKDKPYSEVLKALKEDAKVALQAGGQVLHVRRGAK